MIRRIVVSDDPNYDYTTHVGAGESVLVADKKNGSGLLAARVAVKAATGVDPPDPTCAVVDKDGLVVKIIAADPALDAVDQHQLVAAYVGVFAGCTYDKPSDTFIAPAKVIPAGVDPEGTSHPQTTDPGGPVPKPAKADDASVLVKP